MSDLTRAVQIVKTWRAELVTKGTRSSSASSRRLATIAKALEDAEAAERKLAAVREVRAEADRRGALIPPYKIDAALADVPADREACGVMIDGGGVRYSKDEQPSGKLRFPKIAALPVNRCLLSHEHGPHDWWYTSSGGGHMLRGEPTEGAWEIERNLKQHHCPGVPADRKLWGADHNAGKRS